MNKIGFAHGVLHKVLNKYSKDIFDIYKNCGCEIIEINCMRHEEVNKLKSIIPYLKTFSYISIHLPTDIKYKKNKLTIDALDKISDFYKLVNADLALVHPDLVEDWSVFNGYPLNWAIENMDNKKRSFKAIRNLRQFLMKHKNWKLVLDLNHCYSNDRSMKLADKLIDEFKNNIKEIHLSGYINLHEPLFKTKQNQIIKYCKKLNAPIIIESVFDAVDGVEKEYKYINNILKSK